MRRGWSLQNPHMQRQDIPPAGPTRWEQLLAQEQLKEHEALLILQGRGKKSAQLREWIVRYRDSAYVPEKALEVICVKTRWS